MDNPELVISESIYSSKYTNITRDVISMGEIHAIREVVNRPPAVAMIPVLRDGTILMVKQYRWAARDFLLEFPAGKVEEGMAVEETALKELREEVGYAAGHIDFLGKFFASPGYSTEQIHVFRAINLMPDKLQGDDDEDIEVVPMHYDQIRNAILDGTIKDGKTISSFFLYTQRREYFRE